MTRRGKFRPFILFFAVPLLVMSFLTFHVPSGWGDAATLLYVYLTYAVLGLLYSLVNIPYGSLASAMTQSVHQRAKLIAGRTLGAAACSSATSSRRRSGRRCGARSVRPVARCGRRFPTWRWRPRRR